MALTIRLNENERKHLDSLKRKTDLKTDSGMIKHLIVCFQKNLNDQCKQSNEIEELKIKKRYYKKMLKEIYYHQEDLNQLHKMIAKI